ncbi:MAG: NRDE family protein [Bacteroidota bacterium]
MCLILFSYENHPRYKLVIAANRDEFYARSTQPAHFWEKESHILAGKDREAGGTWMGISKKGKLSMLTNFRDPMNIKSNAPSRGHLVSDYLLDGDDAYSYLKNLEASGATYNGFNLICGSIDKLHYFGNYQNGVHEISTGVHGLSNALLNTPWPKVKKGKADLQAALEAETISPESLFNLLYDDVYAKESDLPDTGVGLEKERMLSPLFIKSSHYGSRCSTVILIDKSNRVQFLERTYNIADFTSSTVSFEFQV